MKKLYLLYFLLFLSFNICGQNKLKKNAISFTSFVGFSKTNIYNFEEVGSSSYLRNYLYKTEKPSQAVLGFSYGGYYLRKVNKKIGLSIGFRLASKGQKSPEFYSINGIPDNALSENYDGSFYKFTIKSVEIPLLAYYDFKTINRFTFFAKTGISTDIYRVFYGEYFTRELGNSNFDLSSKHTLFHFRTSLIPQLRHHINEGIVRIGGIAGSGVKFTIFSFLELKTEFEFSYYGDILRSKNKPPSSIVRGSFYSVGINSGIVFKF